VLKGSLEMQTLHIKPNSLPQETQTSPAKKERSFKKVVLADIK